MMVVVAVVLVVSGGKKERGGGDDDDEVEDDDEDDDASIGREMRKISASLLSLVRKRALHLLSSLSVGKTK